MILVAGLLGDFHELCEEVRTQLAFGFASGRPAVPADSWLCAGRPQLLLQGTWASEVTEGRLTLSPYSRRKAEIATGAWAVRA